MSKLLENPFLQILMAPFSLIYKWVMQFRNHLFNIGYKPVFEFDQLIISVGNLAVGGTGKTPMVEYLVRFIRENYSQTALTMLSRGYGRKTKGFILAHEQSSAREIGDEPFQLYNKFKNAIDVAVCEDRVLAVPSILLEKPENKVVLLDDAFQHRPIKANFSIVLSSFDKPFYDDYVLPAGRLREGRKGINRADVLIFTKCPLSISNNEMNKMRQRAAVYFKKEAIYFTGIQYGKILSELKRPIKRGLVVVTGIANPALMLDYLSQEFKIIRHFNFADHHFFTVDELNHINTIAEQNNADVICTEKDWVRIMDHKSLFEILSDKLYYLPMMVQFLEGEQAIAQKLKGLLSAQNESSKASS